MIIIKYIILMLVFILSFYTGIIISKKYTNRVAELKSMKNALSMFETKIKFTYESIPEVFEEISKHFNDNIGKIFKTSYELMKHKPAGESWINSVDTIDTNMNKEDKTILKNLGKLLGKTDIEGQISEINLVLDFLNTQIDIAENDRKKNEKMYKTLGAIIGLTIVIVLV